MLFRSPQLPKSGSWRTVFDTVDRLLSNDAYSHVYCLIDFDKVIDENAHTKYQNRKKQLEKTGRVTVFECNPCFEMWFLSHYEKTAKIFDNCTDVNNSLKKYIHDYAKDEKYFKRKEIYDFLKPKQGNATKNALFLELNRDDFDIKYPKIGRAHV